MSFFRNGKGVIRLGEDITEALWGSRVSASMISYLNQKIFEGVEEHKDYGSMLKTKAKEGITKIGLILCGLTGFACLFIGGISLTK